MELGVDEPTRMQIMGQSASRGAPAYLHVDQKQTRAALDRLGARLLPN
jgi:hypothetical protein